MTKKIFIDGQAGTTGLLIEYLVNFEKDWELIRIDPAKRKDWKIREAAYLAADLSIICLPNEAAAEAIELLKNHKGLRLLDASSQNRVDPLFTYGLPEITPAQPARIAAAHKVSNPGCYATGFLLAVAPLRAAGLLPPEALISVQATSGYSGGGKQMILKYLSGPQPQLLPYALTQDHKHLPEMQKWAGLAHAPHFLPSVGNYFSGITLQVPLFFTQLTKQINISALKGLYQAYYAQALKNTKVRFWEEPLHLDQPSFHFGNGPLEAWAKKVAGATLYENFLETLDFEPELINLEAKQAWLKDFGSMEISILGNADKFSIFAVFNNLGKGAASQAIENAKLMLGS